MEHVENHGESGSAQSVGMQLREAREAAGLSRSDIAARTKVAERHLQAIEEDRFGDLAARTYAVGFSRTYARALGLDEEAIAARVRVQLDAEGAERAETVPAFEPGDPARIPPVRLAWVAGAAVVVVIALLLVFWGSYLSPEAQLPDLTAEATQPAPGTPGKAPAIARRGPAAPAPAPTSGPVVLTATQDHVWVSVTDKAGTRLLQRELAKGESWTVPADAAAPELRTGRPDILQISVGGKAIAPLAEKPVTMSGVSLVPQDLLARAAAPAGALGPAAGVPAPGRPASPVSTVSG